MKEDDQWAMRWQDYQETARTEHGSLTTAQASEWNNKQHHLHKGLLKVESHRDSAPHRTYRHE